MAEVSTNVLVDLTGLNKVYKTTKDRVDRIVKGDTAVKYASQIGTTSTEGSVSPTTVGSSINPVYVSSGTITPIITNTNTSHTITLGNSNTTTFTLGSSDSTAVLSNSFSASSEVSAPICTASSEVTSPKVTVSGSSNKKVSLQYDSSLDALVFNFT